MEVTNLWQVIVRRWWLIAIPTLVALLLSLPALKGLLSPPVSYTASIRYSASAKPDDTGTFQDHSYTPWLASEYTINNLAAWMHTGSFADEVSAALAKQGKVISADAIRASVTSDNARSIMTLIFTSWPDADELTQIGQAATGVLQDKANDYFPQAAAQKLYVVPLDGVTAARVSSSILDRLAPLLRIGIGFVLGLALAFSVEWLDPTIRTRSELERLGLPVIVEVPLEK